MKLGGGGGGGGGGGDNFSSLSWKAYVVTPHT